MRLTRFWALAYVVVGEVTTLAHEAGDDTVEGGALEAESLLASAESTEVLRGLGNYILAKLHDNLAKRLCRIQCQISFPFPISIGRNNRQKRETYRRWQ